MGERQSGARKTPAGRIKAVELDERIRRFEQIYEMSSDNMAHTLSLGVVRETAEIAEWMQACQARQSLRERNGATGMPEPAPKSRPIETEPKAVRQSEGRKIPVRKVTSQELRAELESSIQEFERRYEMASADMLQCLSMGTVRETGDILKWMFDYHGLQRISKEEIPTDGILGITS